MKNVTCNKHGARKNLCGRNFCLRGGCDPKPRCLTRSESAHLCGSHTLREINKIPAGSISLIRERGDGSAGSSPSRQLYSKDFMG